MNQEKLYEMQMLDQQVRQMQQVVESIDAQLSEINTTKNALLAFKELKNNNEILFPLANGIFAHGKLDNSRKLKVNVGNDVVVEKSADETIELMSAQVQEIEAYKKEVLSQMEKMILKLQEMEAEIEQG